MSSVRWYDDTYWETVIVPNLQTTQSNYTAAQTTYNNLLGTYQTDRQNLADAIATLQQLINQGAPQAQIDAAKLNVQNKQATFSSTQSQFNTASQNLNTASQALVNAQDAGQDRIDSLGDSNINGYVAQLLPEIGTQLTSGGVISTGLDTQLQNANNARIQDLVAYNAALSSYRQNENQLALQRVNLNSLSDQLLLAQAQMLVTNSPSDISAFNALQVQVQAAQNTVTGLLSNRTTVNTNLQNAFTTYTQDLQTLISVMQTAAGPQADTYINQIQQEIQTVDQQFDDAIAFAQANDAQNLALHFSLYPTNFSLVDQQIAQATTAYENTRNATFSSGIVGQRVVSITLPAIPSPDEGLSFADMMRLISGSQLILRAIRYSSADSDNHLSEFRFKLWSAETSLFTEKAEALNNYIDFLYSVDLTYDQNVDAANRANTNTVAQEVATYNANLPALNAAIDALNAQIDAQNQGNQDAVNDLNNTTPIYTDVYNQGAEEIPGTQNTLNQFGLDQTLPQPTPIVDPPQVPQPTTIQHFPHLNPIPVPSPTIGPPGADPTTIPTVPTQQEINNYNDILRSVNEQLAPLGNVAQSILGFTSFPPITIGTYITVRDQTNLIDYGTTTALFTDIYGILKRSILSQAYTYGSALHPGQAQIEDLQTALKTAPTSSSTTGTTAATGAGAGLVASTIIRNETAEQALTQVFSSQDVQTYLARFIDDQSIIGGIAASARLPLNVKDFYSLGVARWEIGETQTEDLKQLDSVIREEVINALLAKANDPNGIGQAAREILALHPELASMGQADLQDLLTAIKQVLGILLLQAAVTLAVPAGFASPDVAINSLFETPTNLRALNYYEQLRASTVGDLHTLLNNVLAALDERNKQAIKQDINRILEQQNLQKLDESKSLSDAIVKTILASSETTRATIQKEIADAVLRHSQTAFDQNRVDVSNRAITASEIMQNELRVNLSKIDQNKRSLIESRLPAPPAPHVPTPPLPSVPTLLPQDRKDILVALLTRAITPDQASQIIQRLLTQDSLRKGLGVGVAVNTAQSQETKQGLPVSDITINRLKDALHKLDVQFGDDQFSRGFLASFKTFIATESDFYKFSLRMILDPAQSMVKNFSIQTRDSTGRGMQTALVIPISG